jgi:hypothetical protein
MINNTAQFLFGKYSQDIISKNIHSWDKNLFKKTYYPQNFAQELSPDSKKEIDEIIRKANCYQWRIYFPESQRYAMFSEIMDYHNDEKLFYDSSLKFTLQMIQNYLKDNKKLGIDIEVEIHAYDRLSLVPWFCVDYQTIKSS